MSTDAVTTLQSTRLTDSCVYHGEGPVWDAATGRLHWVDMLAGDLMTMAGTVLADAVGGSGGPDGAGVVAADDLGRLRCSQVLAAVRPRAGGGLVMAVERGFAVLDAGSSTPTALTPLWSDPDVRMNEGGCDPQGRFYAGTMADDRRTGSASVFRLDPDGSEALVLEGATISNGLAWSPGGGIAYWNDTPTQCVAVLAHDADSGSLTRQGVFTEIPEGLGAPDGLTLDDQGGVWVALNGGAAVHRYAPDGRLDVVVRVGAEQVTACTFAGEDLRDLVITTSREDLPAGVDPAAGSLFHCRPGHRGLPTATFAG